MSLLAGPGGYHWMIYFGLGSDGRDYSFTLVSHPSVLGARKTHFPKNGKHIYPGAKPILGICQGTYSFPGSVLFSDRLLFIASDAGFLFVIIKANSETLLDSSYVRLS